MKRELLQITFAAGIIAVTSATLPLCAEEVTGEEATFISDRNVLKFYKAVIEEGG